VRVIAGRSSRHVGREAIVNIVVTVADEERRIIAIGDIVGGRLIRRAEEKVKRRVRKGIPT